MYVYISRTFYSSGFPKNPGNGPLVSVVHTHTPAFTSIFPPLPIQPSQLTNLERTALSLPPSPCFLNKILILQGPLFSKNPFSLHGSVSTCVWTSHWWFSIPIETTVVSDENDTFKPLYHYLLTVWGKEKKSHPGNERWHVTKMGLFLLPATLLLARRMAMLDRYLKRVVHDG